MSSKETGKDVKHRPPEHSKALVTFHDKSGSTYHGLQPLEPLSVSNCIMDMSWIGMISRHLRVQPVTALENGYFCLAFWLLGLTIPV